MNQSATKTRMAMPPARPNPRASPGTRPPALRAGLKPLTRSGVPTPPTVPLLRSRDVSPSSPPVARPPVPLPALLETPGSVQYARPQIHSPSLAIEEPTLKPLLQGQGVSGTPSRLRSSSDVIPRTCACQLKVLLLYSNCEFRASPVSSHEPRLPLSLLPIGRRPVFSYGCRFPLVNQASGAQNGLDSLIRQA